VTYAGRTATDGLVVVTGANGFIGRHLLEKLAGRGKRVRGVTRSVAGLTSSGTEAAFAPDILDREAIRSALRGASAVVHLAAMVHANTERRDDPASECRRINVDGTSLVLDEAISAGVRTFLFISSVKAVANESDRILTDETPPQPVDAYGESKLEAERLVRVRAAREGLHAPILRLPNVYGPGMKANMNMLFKVIDKGIPLPFGAVRNRRSFAYIDNAVSAIEALLESAGAAHGTYYVSDEEDLSTPELVRHIARALGRPPRLLPVPETLLRGMRGAGGLLSRFLPLNVKGDSLTAVLGSLFVDTSRLRETTGYAPPISVERGMVRTAEWYRTRSQTMS